jgi:hypothetical protein
LIDNQKEKGKGAKGGGGSCSASGTAALATVVRANGVVRGERPVGLYCSPSLMRGFPGENGGGGGAAAVRRRWWTAECAAKSCRRQFAPRRRQPRHFQLKRVVSPLGVTVKLVGAFSISLDLKV